MNQTTVETLLLDDKGGRGWHLIDDSTIVTKEYTTVLPVYSVPLFNLVQQMPFIPLVISDTPQLNIKMCIHMKITLFTN